MSTKKKKHKKINWMYKDKRYTLHDKKEKEILIKDDHV